MTASEMERLRSPRAPRQLPLVLHSHQWSAQGHPGNKELLSQGWAGQIHLGLPPPLRNFSGSLP